MMKFGIHFATFENIRYFYLIFLLMFFLIIRIMKKRKQVRKIVADRYLKMMLHNYSFMRNVIKTLLVFCGTVFLIAALLRPQWDKKEENISQEGRDLIIAIDISRSMLAKDVKPNRLDFAKTKIKKLLYNLSCERVGLIVFSGSTFMQCPLTTDYAAFFLFLDQLDVDTVASGSTALDQAIKESLRVFESIPTRKTKLLVAFTDGEDFSNNLAGVKEKVIQDKLSIFTVGIGTKNGAPIPIIQDDGSQIGWEKDEQGNVIMSCLNEKLLMNLAYESGGKYVHAVDSDDDINLLITSINKFEKDKLSDKTFEAFQEQYPCFIAISLISFALEWIL